MRDDVPATLSTLRVLFILLVDKMISSNTGTLPPTSPIEQGQIGSIVATKSLVSSPVWNNHNFRGIQALIEFPRPTCIASLWTNSQLPAVAMLHYS